MKSCRGGNPTFSRTRAIFHKRFANARIVTGGGLRGEPTTCLAASGGSPAVATDERIARPLGLRRMEPRPIFTVAGDTLAERSKALQAAKGGGKPFAAGEVDLPEIR